jgi:hypothetical protein
MQDFPHYALVRQQNVFPEREVKGTKTYAKWRPEAAVSYGPT